MKVNDQVTMCFSFAGIVSEEQVIIIKITDKEIIIEDVWHSDESGEEENGRFDRKTGKCLNDNTYLGARRSIKI